MILNTRDLANMERRERAAFVNCLSGFKAANLVGTADPAGHYNLAIMSSAVHLGSHPPLLALVMRPDDAGQHTLANILEGGFYSLNHVREPFFAAAHQTAARYPRAVSEFAAVGLTPELLGDFPAPFVAESTVRMGLVLREHQKLAINGTHFVIGEVVLVDVPQDSITADGSIDIAAAGTVTVSGLDSYYRVQPLAKLPYAKPEIAA
jgi:flavin reductase (DIM6/NTAB) family NADH-FMN oxidoreductase RutF